MIGREKDLSRKQDRLAFTVRELGPERLDRHLGAALSWKSRAQIQAMIGAGKVRVNGAPAKPSRKVRAGDEVVVDLATDASAPPDYDRIDLEVLYEDEWLVAINKPPGLLVHPVGPHVYDTLINWLHHRYRDLRHPGGEPVRPRLCHRIDKDTTGVVLVGKEAHAHNELRHQFENRQISKEYHALVSGIYPEDRSIDLPIGEGGDLATSLAHPALKPSRTVVRVLARFERHSLLSCVPTTGRQNQIRIHLAAVGFPIVGDERYGSCSPEPGFPERYLLHSRRLRFHHPRLKTWADLTAPLPPDFVELLERLRRG